MHPGGRYDNTFYRSGPPGYIGWRYRFLGIDSLESISGLLKRLQIRALYMSQRISPFSLYTHFVYFPSFFLFAYKSNLSKIILRNSSTIILLLFSNVVVYGCAKNFMGALFYGIVMRIVFQHGSILAELYSNVVVYGGGIKKFSARFRL
jgi:hypothetical protein